MFVETAMRYIFSRPSIWTGDICYLIAGIYFLLGGAYVMREHGHVNMNVIYDRFSLRTRAIVDLFTASLFFLFCYAILWYGLSIALRSLIIQETTPPPASLPLYPTKIALPVGVFLLGIQGLTKFIVDFITAISGKKYEY